MSTEEYDLGQSVMPYFAAWLWSNGSNVVAAKRVTECLGRQVRRWARLIHPDATPAQLKTVGGAVLGHHTTERSERKCDVSEEA